MREDAPQLETVADVEALHRQGERRALAALVRALQARGSLPAEWVEALCAMPTVVAAALGLFRATAASRIS